MISLTNRTIMALQYTLNQLKIGKTEKLASHKDVPFAVVKYVEKGDAFEKAVYAKVMGKPNGVSQGSYLLRNITKLNGVSSNSKYYICKIADVMAAVPWIQRICNKIIDSYYGNMPAFIYIKTLPFCIPSDIGSFTFKDFARLISLLDVLLEYAPIHFHTRNDYQAADNGSGPRLLGSPLEQLLIMEREGASYEKYETVLADNKFTNNLCVQHVTELETISWSGYTTPLKLPILSTFFWDVNGFSIGMLQSRVLMLSTPKGGNPTWYPGSFHYGLTRISDTAYLNARSGMMLNRELKVCNAVDQETFDKMRRAMVILSSLPFNAQFYLSANYGTPPKTLKQEYIHRSCPSRGCFVRVNNRYVQIPAFVVDSNDTSYQRDVDCAFSNSPLPRFYSGNANLANSSQGYGCYAHNVSAGKSCLGHLQFKRAYQNVLKSCAKPLVACLGNRVKSLNYDLNDKNFALIINGIESSWRDSMTKSMAYLFVNNIQDDLLDNHFEHLTALITPRLSCDIPSSKFVYMVNSIMFEWMSALMRWFDNTKKVAKDRLRFDPKFKISETFADAPDLSSVLERTDFSLQIAHNAIDLLDVNESEHNISDIMMRCTDSGIAFLPGSIISDASAIYGELGITDPDLLSALPARPALLSNMYEDVEYPESMRIPGAYDTYSQWQEETDDPIAQIDVKRNRKLVLDRLHWRVIFGQKLS